MVSDEENLEAELANAKTMADEDAIYRKYIYRFVPNHEICPLYGLKNDVSIFDDPNWVRTDIIDLHALAPGTFVYALGGHMSAFYTILVNKQGIDLWHRIGCNGFSGPIDSIISFGGEDEPFFLRGILKRRHGFIMPYFEYDSNRPANDCLVDEGSTWCDGYEALFIRQNPSPSSAPKQNNS